MSIELMSIDLLIKASTLVFSLLEKLKISNVNRKERVSFLLEEISILLESVADSLESGEYPHQKCDEMKYYSEELVESLQSIIKKEKAEELQKSLMEASELERLFGERTEDSIIEIRKCAGSFKAASVLIKV